ncbi:MAG TPA: hypothetical protein VJI32_05325 [Candidatus Nanoarchaeia archaeon]|nr:hypothetical protein [Candidatus Nanoarchaeia archaeon]
MSKFEFPVPYKALERGVRRFLTQVTGDGVLISYIAKVTHPSERVYVATFPDLEERNTWGKNKQEMSHNAHLLLTELLGVILEQGKALPKPKYKPHSTHSKGIDSRRFIEVPYTIDDCLQEARMDYISRYPEYGKRH